MSEAITMTGSLEPRSGWVAQQCSIEKALGVLRTRSAFVILREAYYGATRFDEFATRARLSDPVTATRLRELVAAGLLRPRALPGARPAHARRVPPDRDGRRAAPGARRADAMGRPLAAGGRPPSGAAPLGLRRSRSLPSSAAPTATRSGPGSSTWSAGARFSASRSEPGRLQSRYGASRARSASLSRSLAVLR